VINLLLMLIGMAGEELRWTSAIFATYHNCRDCSEYRGWKWGIVMSRLKRWLKRMFMALKTVFRPRAPPRGFSGITWRAESKPLALSTFVFSILYLKFGYKMLETRSLRRRSKNQKGRLAMDNAPLVIAALVIFAATAGLGWSYVRRTGCPRSRAWVWALATGLAATAVIMRFGILPIWARMPVSN